MKIVVLGSSGAIPTKQRNLPSIALIYESEILLFDCGEGTQRQMMKYNLNYSKVSKIFISHLHLDHYLGVFGILETANLINRETPIKIFGPQGIQQIFGKYKSAEIIELNENKEIFENKKYFISAFKLKHNIPLCLGYLFKEKSKIKFYEEKAKKVGLKGQQFTEIQNKGKLKIDNKVIKLSDISYTKEGKKIVFVADTLPIDTAIKYSKDADLLIHEATYLSSLEKEAKENFHSTAKQAAEIAKKANVKKLLLFHISQRHKNPQELEKEAKKVFKNTICSKDGLVLEI